MDEITKLQAEFMRIQKQESSNNISERVCIEILLKLIQRNKITVFFTSDRKEYLTPSQLSREIYDEILSNGGRIEITDLFPLLNLDETIIENSAKELVNKEQNLSIIGYTIIDDHYLDRIAEEINESLIESGKLELLSLSQRFNLPLELITNIIRVRLLSSPPSKHRRFIDGYLEPPLLYTKMFINRHSSILCGLLSAITIPTLLQKITQRFEFDESLFFSIFNDLLQSGRIKGSLQGRGETTEFVPDIYSKHRELSINQFFKQNGYIDYKTLQEQYKITNPTKYIKTNFPNSILLPSCCLSSKQISFLEDSIDECIQSEEWLNVQPLLPSPLNDDDIHSVLRECKHFKQVKKQSCLLMNKQYIISNGFLTNLLPKYEEEYKIWAKEDSSSRKELIASADNLRLSSGSTGSLENDNDNDDNENLRKSKGRKNKRRNKKNKKQQQLSSSNSNIQNLVETYTEQNRNYLKSWYPDIPDCLIEGIVQELNSKLVDLREKAAKAIFMDSSAKKKFDGKDWQIEVQQLYYNIIQYNHAANNFTGDSNPLDKYLLRTLCTDLSHLLIEAAAAQNFIKLDHSPIESVKQRNLALKKLAKAEGNIHNKLTNICSTLTKTCDEYIIAIEDIFDILGLSIKPLDKRNEKKLVNAHKESLISQFNNETNAANAFHVGVMVLYVSKIGQALHVPGKMIVDVVQELNTKIEKSQDFIEIVRFGDKVKEYLIAKIKKQDNHSDLFNNIQDLLPEFKKIILTQL